MTPDEEFARDELLYYVNTLNRIAINLRMYGLFALITTLFNLFVVLMSLMRLLSGFNVSAVSAILTVSAILLCVGFDQARRRGEVIYGEVTDELHRRAYLEGELERGQPLQYRVSIKTFVTATDMPLMPGKLGPLAYIAFNLATLCGYAFLYRNAMSL